MVGRPRNDQGDQETSCNRTDSAKHRRAPEAMPPLSDRLHIPKALCLQFRARLIVESFLSRRQRTELLAKDYRPLQFALELMRLRKLFLELLTRASMQLAERVFCHPGFVDIHEVTPIFSRLQSRRSVWSAV